MERGSQGPLGPAAEPVPVGNSFSWAAHREDKTFAIQGMDWPEAKGGRVRQTARASSPISASVVRQ
jgi:hypothetical protein